jgi:hypothetical protein
MRFIFGVATLQTTMKSLKNSATSANIYLQINPQYTPNRSLPSSKSQKRTVPSDKREELEAPISLNEIELAVRKLAPHNTPGPDGLGTEYYNNSATFSPHTS